VDEWLEQVFYRFHFTRFGNDPSKRKTEDVLCVGANLPFDLGSISKRAGLARGRNYGGLCLTLLEKLLPTGGDEAAHGGQLAEAGESAPAWRRLATADVETLDDATLAALLRKAGIT
jgi:hypothetical protein